MPEYSSRIRFYTDGSGQVKAAIEGIGTSADQTSTSLVRFGRQSEDMGRKLRTSAGEGALGFRDLSGVTRELSGVMGDFAAPIGRVGGALSSLGPIGLAAAAGLGAVVGLLGAGFREAAESERSLNRINALIRASGNASKVSAAEIQAFAGELSQKTLATADDVMTASGILLTFHNVQGAAFFRTLQLATDLAEVTGQDLVSATRLLGRAVNDPAQGLASLGRQIGVTDDQTKEWIKTLDRVGDSTGATNEALSSVERIIGGAGAAGREGLTGKVHDLAEAWDQLLETMGRTEKEGGPVSDFLKDLTGFLDRTTENISPDDRFGGPLSKRVYLQRRDVRNKGDLNAGLGGYAAYAGRQDEILSTITDPRFAAEQYAFQGRGGLPNAAAFARAPGSGQTAEEAWNSSSGFYMGMDAGLNAALNARREREERDKARRTRSDTSAADRAMRQRLEMLESHISSDDRAALAQLGMDAAKGRAAGEKAVAEIERDQKEALDKLRDYHRARLEATNQNVQLLNEQEAERFKFIEDSLKAGLISEQEAASARADLEALKVEDYKQAREQELNASKKWEDGVERAFDNYVEMARDAASQAEELIGGSIANLEDAWVQFATTGKASFDDLISFVESELARMAFRKIAAPAIDQFGDVLTEAIGSIFHGGGLVGYDAAPTRRVPASTFRGAPRFHAGLMPDERPAILQKGEAVIPRGLVGALGSNVSIKIYDQRQNGGQAIQRREKQGGNGKREIEFYVRDQVTRLADRGDLDPAFSHNYGVPRAPLRRS